MTEEDCNTILDYYNKATDVNRGSWATWFRQVILGNQGDYDIMFISVSYSGKEYKIIPLNYEQIVSVENLNNVNYMKVNFTGTTWSRSCVYNGANYTPSYYVNQSLTGSFLIGNGAQTNTQYIFYNNDIPNVTDGPYQSENVLDLSPPYIFDIDIKTNNDTQYFSITTEFNNTINDIPVIYSNDFGYFYDNTYKTLINDNLQFWYYNGTTWVSKQIFNRSNQSWVLVPSNSYIDILYDSSNNNEMAYLTLKDIISYKNVVFEYTINNVDLNSARGFFLIGTENTVVNNGVIDTSCFGNDYLNQFQGLNQIINDNNNTQQIIDNVNDDSEVENILQSISSGDDIGSLAHNLGIVTIENPFTDIVFGIFNGAIDSLTYSGDVSLNFGFQGQDIYIKSSDFATPTNTITTFIGFIMDALFVYALYWYYFMIIESIKNFTFYQDIVNNSKWNVTASSNGDLSWRLL